LTLLDRQGPIQVRKLRQLGWKKGFARHTLDGRQDRGVGNAPGADLMLD
jgi:hypothetical protein